MVSNAGERAAAGMHSSAGGQHLARDREGTLPLCNALRMATLKFAFSLGYEFKA